MILVSPSNVKIVTNKKGYQVIHTSEFSYTLPPRVRAYLVLHKDKGYLLTLIYIGLVKRYTKSTKVVGNVRSMIENFIEEVLRVEDIYDSKLSPTKAFGNNQSCSERLQPYYLLREGDYGYCTTHRLYSIETGKWEYISKTRLLELANKHNTDIYGYVDLLFKRFLDTKLSKEDLLNRFVFK